MPTTAELDAEHRAWLRKQLARIAGELGVTVVGEPVHGWHDRTIGVRVTTGDEDRWLRRRRPVLRKPLPTRHR